MNESLPWTEFIVEAIDTFLFEYLKHNQDITLSVTMKKYNSMFTFMFIHEKMKYCLFQS